MNVVAISTPSSVGWRWRIVDYSGQMVEESDGTFGSIESAITHGVERMRARDERHSANTASASSWGRR
jgi:hypothetical protein